MDVVAIRALPKRLRSKSQISGIRPSDIDPPKSSASGPLFRRAETELLTNPTMTLNPNAMLGGGGGAVPPKLKVSVLTGTAVVVAVCGLGLVDTDVISVVH